MTPIVETYNTIKNWADNGQLVAGQQYLMTDFQTLHIIPNTTDRNDCGTPAKAAKAYIKQEDSVVFTGTVTFKIAGVTQFTYTFGSGGNDANGGLAEIADIINAGDYAFTASFENTGGSGSGTYNELFLYSSIAGNSINNTIVEIDYSTGTDIITSFQGGKDAVEIPIEPLILTAISTSEFDGRVTSIVYPKDEIYYDITGDRSKTGGENIDLPENHKGWIYTRNRGQSIKCGFDFLNVIYRRWHCDVSSYTLDGYDTDVPLLYNTSINIGTSKTLRASSITLISNDNYSDYRVFRDSIIPPEEVVKEECIITRASQNVVFMPYDFREDPTYYIYNYDIYKYSCKAGNHTIYGRVNVTDSLNWNIIHYAPQFKYNWGPDSGELGATGGTISNSIFFGFKVYLKLGNNVHNIFIDGDKRGLIKNGANEWSHFINVELNQCRNLYLDAEKSSGSEGGIGGNYDLIINNCYNFYIHTAKFGAETPERITGFQALNYQGTVTNKPRIGYSEGDILQNNYSCEQGANNTIVRQATPSAGVLDLFTPDMAVGYAGIIEVPDESSISIIWRGIQNQHDLVIKALGTCTITLGSASGILGTGTINLVAGNRIRLKPAVAQTYVTDKTLEWEIINITQ